MANNVELKTACMDDLDVYAFREAASGRLRITGVAIDGQLSVPTVSFWRSMFGEVGLASQVGPRFDEYTWFLRLRNAHPHLVFRYAEVTDRHGNSLLMGQPRDGQPWPSDPWEEETYWQGDVELMDEGVPDTVPDPELDDYAAERLAHHWGVAKSASDDGMKDEPIEGDLLMTAPEGGIRPSLN